MTINPEWENIFRTRSWGQYPDLELVRFCMRQWPDRAARENTTVLELGCGTGANIKMLFENGFTTHGIDGSKTAIEKCWPYLDYTGVKKNGIVGDVSDILSYYNDNSFDLIIDVGCFMHQNETDRETIVESVWKLLKPKGKFFFSELVSIYCTAWEELGMNEDIKPEDDLILVKDKMFQPDIPYHFFDDGELLNLFKNFQNLSIETTMRTYNSRYRLYDRWIVSGSKP